MSNTYYGYTTGCCDKPTPAEKDCECGKPSWVVPPPPVPMPPYDIPVYPYPYPFPPPPKPCDCDCDDVKIKKKSLEAQICELSKKSAAINKMIDNYKEKKKDAIIKIGDASYNFGGYYDEDDAATEYGETILELLTKELAKIKEKIAELAAKLGEED